MDRKRLFALAWLALGVVLFSAVVVPANTSAPTSAVKLIFIHHSCGENWLNDGNGDLGTTLDANNYFVSDTNYGWGPAGDTIGDRTDIGHWYDWFVGTNSATYLAALYSESDTHSGYTRTLSDPGGENQIIMFKSCFPNSQLGGGPNDPATTGSNPLQGQDCTSSDHTVANAKDIYNDILENFAAHQEKLFIAITAPPLVSGGTDATAAANARAFNNWLVNNWLASYPYHNVAVFDFYNVMTSNGGSTNTNDLGLAAGNHHRWWNGAVQHSQTVNSNTAAYASDPSDSHPTSAGNLKATGEFVPLLNYYYNLWQGTPAATYRYYLPYFTERTGYWDGVGLSNCSATQSAHVTITVYDETGQTRGDTNLVIPPNGQQPAVVASTSGTVQEGWMLVTSDQPLGGLCFFGTSGAGSYMADISLISATATSLLIPHVAQNATWDTYLLFCNPNTSANTVTLTFTSPAGVTGQPDVHTVPAMASEQVSLSSLLGGGTTSGGKVTISATQGVAAFALYTDLNHGGTRYSGISAVNPSGQ